MIFVTGGTGFLGRHLIPRLCRAGHPIRVLTRSPNQHPWLKNYPNLEVITGDLQEGSGLHALEGCTHVIHAAALFSMWRGAGDFTATNYQGTRYLLDAAQAVGVKRVVYISTIAVIGNPQPGIVLDEAHPPRPASAYQASKLEAEGLMQAAHRAGLLETVILRGGAFYGPLGAYAFNRLFFRDPMRGIIMQMDGGQYTIFPVYVGDVADAVLLSLREGRAGEIYNISGDPIRHRAAFDIVCEEAGLHWPRLNLPGWLGINFSRMLEWAAHFTGREPFYPLDLRWYVFNDWLVSTEKAQRELGFMPTSFREGARRTIAWYRAGKPDTLPELACD